MNLKFHPIEKGIFAAMAVILFGGLIFVIAEYPAVPEGQLEFASSQIGARHDAATGEMQKTPEIITAKNTADTLEIFLPAGQDKISSPTTITGRAKGWYFEASFPVEILDANKKLLGSGEAQAQSDWMTEDFVDFSAVINFSQPATPTGFVRFSKSNPSGLSKNAEEFLLPVQFTPTLGAEPPGVCKPNLGSCQGDVQICLKNNLNKVCS